MSLTVDFWDVGQGDCSVITLPDGKLFIIDTGPPDSPLHDWLAAYGPQNIHALLLTHNDVDHSGCFEAILERFKTQIDYVWLLEDRNPRTQPCQRLWECALRLRRTGTYKVCRLEADPRLEVCPLFVSMGPPVTSIYCVFPDVAAAMGNAISGTPQPNRVSGIICLDIDGRTEVIWAADAPMKILSEHCKGRAPIMQVGPHHGAPSDRSTRGKPSRSYEQAFEEPKPDHVYVSVGTRNKHQHSIKASVESQHDRGRRVYCSQLNHCDRRRVENREHVMNHHSALGFLPPYPENAVTCRGPIRLTLQGSSFVFDKYHDEHATQINGLHHAMCQGR